MKIEFSSGEKYSDLVHLSYGTTSGSIIDRFRSFAFYTTHISIIGGYTIQEFSCARIQLCQDSAVLKIKCARIQTVPGIKLRWQVLICCYNMQPI